MTGAADIERLKQQVQTWRDELIDLSRRNRLIHMPLTGRTTALEIVQPDLDAVILGLAAPVGGGWRFHYPPVEDKAIEDDPTLFAALEAEDPDLDDEIHPDELVTTATEASKLSARLRNTATKAGSEYMDKGLRVLYLAAGMLEWADGEGNDLTSPLVLIPVLLERNSPRDPYRLRSADEDWVVNPALAVKLQQEFGIVLPELEADEGLAGFLDAVDGAVGDPKWKVTERCALATLSFAKETMYRDLLENEAAILEHSIVGAMALGDVITDDLAFDAVPDDELDQRFPPEDLNSILDADATQRACIVAAKEGNSFVMDGPPGSGKSQTIANIIAELLAARRSVLFVSEKAAALEVVKKRLDDAQLGEFVLELHSHKATRKEVAQALGHAVLQRVTIPGRAADADIARVAARRKELSAYAAAMNEVRSQLGESLHDVLGRCGQLGESPVGPPPDGLFERLDREGLQQLLDTAQRLANSWGPVERGSSFLWRDVAQSALDSPSVRLSSQLDELLKDLERLGERAEQLHGGVLGPSPSTWVDYERLAALSALFDSRPDLDPVWLTIDEFDEVAHDLDQLQRKAVRRADLVAALDADLPTWRSLPVGDDLDRAITSLVPHLAAPEETDGLTLAQTRSLADSARSGIETLRVIGDLSSDLRAMVGLPGTGLSFADLQGLLELTELASAPSRPERSWLDEQTLSSAHDAVRRVRPLVEEWRQLEGQVRAHFNENIENLDVEQFYDSPNDVEAKLGRLSPRGRANRRQLAACSPSGKVTSEMVSALPLARSWNRLTARLNSLDGTEVLGRYFEGTRTDLASVEAAVSVAEKALVLAGPGADRAALGASIGVDSLDIHGLGSKRAELVSQIDRWHGIEREHLVPVLPAFEPYNGLTEAVARLETTAFASDVVASAASPYTVDGTDTLAAAARRARDRAEVAGVEVEFNLLPDSARFGRLFAGLDTDWSAVNRAIAWSKSARNLLGGPITRDGAELVGVIERDPEYEAIVTESKKGLATVPLWFDEPQRSTIAADLSGRLDDAVDLVGELRSTMSDLEEWRRFAEARSDLVATGYGSLVEHAEREVLASTQVQAFFERTVLRTWADQVLTSDRRLRPERAVDRDAVVDEFRSLDRMLAASAARRVVSTCNDRRPTTLVGEAAILKREAEKKRKHMPVRELLHRAGRVAQDVKPCFMMSPLAVSQFLPPDLHFDVVVFDEASQVRPCDAINAIYRGTQLIIAGDERQLPPTSFFDRTVTDDADAYDEDDTADFESVLKLAQGSAGINSLPLRWHYRSRHESLITFSNREFYESELITYPGAIHEAEDLGVHFVLVPDGQYQRGGARDNPTEARKVVERVLHHASTHPELTVGVVAFSEAQASRIGYELEAARRERPDLDDFFGEDRLDGFFIKNLESVQGDERDVIIFSIGYGPDENGKVTMNFGPLNKEGGHRRLNVAATRARRRVEVISSITAGHFTETSNARGVKSLRRYLDFAQRGVAAFAVDDVEEHEPESPFEEDVLAAVRSLGYDVVSQVGQAGYRIDMGVKDPASPGRYVLGIECDGAAYHSSVVARDRDRLRQEVLEGLGWRLHRIWGPAWYRERGRELDRLRVAIESAIAGESAPTLRADRPTYEPAVVEEVEELLAPWAEIYEPFVPVVGQVPPLEDPNSLPPLRDALRQVVAKLAPVHADTCVAAMREAWDIDRMGARRRDRVEYALQSLVQQGALVRDRHGFYWVAGSDEICVRGGDPSEPSSVRKAALVSPDEVKLAIFYLVQDARSIDEDELFRRVARIFGWSRLGADIAALLRRCCDELQTTGDLDEVVAGGVTVLQVTTDGEPDLS